MPLPSTMEYLLKNYNEVFKRYTKRIPFDNSSMDDFYIGFLSQGKPMNQFRYVLQVMEMREMLVKQLPPNPPSDRLPANSDSGERFLQVGNYLAAMHVYTSLIIDSPPNTMAHARALNRRSRVLYRMGRYNECLEDLERAFDSCENLGPESKGLLFDLSNRKARTIWQLKKVPESIKFLRECIDSVNVLINIDVNKIDWTEDYLCSNVWPALRKLNSISYPLPPQIPESQHRPDLLGGHHELYPKFSKYIWFGQTPDMGTGIFTMRELKPGDVIAIEDCHIGNPTVDSFYVCHNYRCLKVNMTAISCENCSACYCSKRCRDEDFHSAGHEYGCKISSAIKELPAHPKINKLVLKWFLREYKNKGLNSYCSSVMRFESVMDPKIKQQFKRGHCGSFLSAYSLEIDHRCESTKLMYYFNCIAVEMLHFLILAGVKIPDHQLLTVGISLVRMQQVIISNLPNRMPINPYIKIETNDYGDFNANIAFTLYPIIINQINHSCDPNLIISILPDEKTLVLKALKPIQKNDQLFISYGVLLQSHDKNQRDEYLRDKFNFECCCQPCKENWPSIQSIPREISLEQIINPGYFNANQVDEECIQLLQLTQMVNIIIKDQSNLLPDIIKS